VGLVQQKAFLFQALALALGQEQEQGQEASALLVPDQA
jgi:hypothetical protein